LAVSISHIAGPEGVTHVFILKRHAEKRSAMPLLRLWTVKAWVHPAVYKRKDW
jgi:hypothetical protein